MIGERLAPEVVEVLLGQTTLEEGAGVDAGRRVALEEDLVARPLVAAAEEVVVADLVQAGGTGVGGEVPADALEPRVRPQHHGQRVPANEAPDLELHRLVAGEVGLLLRADRVDVAGLRQRRQADLQLTGTLEQLEDDEAGAIRPGGLHQLVE